MILKKHNDTPLILHLPHSLSFPIPFFELFKNVRLFEQQSYGGRGREREKIEISNYWFSS